MSENNEYPVGGSAEDLREAFKVCGNAMGGQRFIISTAYDDATRNFGYQLNELENPDAKVYSYKPLRHTFALHPADCALAALVIIRAEKLAAVTPRETAVSEPTP